MALVKVKDLLKHAEENGYGVPAINVFDYNSIKFAVMAAEEARIILVLKSMLLFVISVILLFQWPGALLFRSLSIWIIPEALKLLLKVSVLVFHPLW